MARMPSRPPNRWSRPVLVGLAVIGAMVGIDTFVTHLATDPLVDVRAYYDAGARLNAGGALYEQPAGTDE